MCYQRQMIVTSKQPKIRIMLQKSLMQVIHSEQYPVLIVSLRLDDQMPGIRRHQVSGKDEHAAF